MPTRNGVIKKITGAMYTWGKDQLRSNNYNPHSSTNTLDRYRKEGEVQSAPARDKILCYDPKEPKTEQAEQILRESNAIQREWLKLDKWQKACVYGKFVETQEIKEDGNLTTAKEVADNLGIGKDKFDEHWSRGVRRINGKLEL